MRCENAVIPLTNEQRVNSTNNDDDNIVFIADADFEDMVYLTSEITMNTDVTPSVMNGKVKSLLEPYASLFTGVGKTDLVQHYIHTSYLHIGYQCI